jgi:hypothetical protein
MAVGDVHGEGEGVVSFNTLPHRTRAIVARLNRDRLRVREQLADVNVPRVRCNSHVEEWDGRVNRCVLNDDNHLDYHTDGCLQWSDATACEGPER